jgi:hypothetical protein
MCNSKKLLLFLDLHDQPPPNRNIKPGDWKKHPEPLYPLKVYFCKDCHLVQLLDAVSGDELYSNYQFFSSGVGNTPQHFLDHAKQIQEKFLRPGDFVVEIGGNDGVLLKNFKNVRILNIDPAKNIAPVARKNGVPTLNKFFNKQTAQEVVKKYGQANLIIGVNSIAHIDNLKSVFAGFKTLLAPNGIGIIQAHYLGELLRTKGYGFIYHEHYSTFSIRPLIPFFKKFGFTIFDYQDITSWNISFRVYFGHQKYHLQGANVTKLAKTELQKKLDKPATYLKFAKSVAKSRLKLIATLKRLKSQGARIAAYGAAAKGVPILVYCGITNDIIDFCVDDLPSKHGLVTPLSHIPIISSTEAHERQVDYYLLLAWNFRDHIVEKEKDFVKKGGKFIMPIGQIEIFPI